VKKRYDDFIEFDYYRFANTKTETYLDKLNAVTNSVVGVQDREIFYEHLEKSHDSVFSLQM
jgi:hypothetical protein